MSQKQVVIYCRYSSDMQRPESCADQEREVRAALPRLGIADGAALVIRDEAESGTRADRAGFRQLRALVARGAVAVLAVDDQSRLSRGDGAYQFVQDLVFAGGRFVSTGEGIDTDVAGWELTFRRDGQFAWLLAHLHAEPEPSGPVPAPVWGAPCHPRCGPFRR